MPEKITIAGKPFDVPHRYEEGHQLTAAEAKALNQIFWENLRNNFQVRVNSAIKAKSSAYLKAMCWRPPRCRW